MIATFVNKYWKWLVLIVILSILGVRVYDRFFAPKPPVAVAQASVVELFTLGDLLDGDISLSCQVEPVSDVAITPESSGTITNIKVEEGETVAEGDTLFEVENIQQRVSLADARVALESAESVLQEALNNNQTGSASSLLAQTQSRQDALVADALNDLFNNDLQVYPENNPEDTNRAGPTVVGNYTCSQEGKYIVDVYSSSSNSGASFRYSGIESGTRTVSTTNFGTLLGNCGLEFIFPEGFDKNETWILPVPNTRSSSYFSLKKAHETAIETRNITLNQTGLSDQELSQERARVNQARLRSQLAADNFNKTIVKAKSGGVVSGLDLDTGDYVTAFAPVGNIKTIDQLELVAYVNASEKRYVSIDSAVTVAGNETQIKNISSTVDSITRKLKATIIAPNDIVLTEGLSVPCTIARTTDTVTRLDGAAIIPLSAISVVGIDPYVFLLNEDETTKAVPVTTGAILGTQIVVYGLESGDIISDARGIKDGVRVSISNK
ncbi:MAG: multidrug efflux pump subunit AcrA (membrane-fusion protein) [Candidatus Paceibacteria bacterium]|jgi:multidrug efflux pump subunit AcrA (membrane-fusion protein)